MSSYDSDTLEEIRKITFDEGDSFLASIGHALSLLQQTKDEAFAAALNSELIHLIGSQSSASSLQLLALGWIGVGRLLFHLTVPDIPLDPMLVEHVNHSRLRREEADLRAQIYLHEELERLVSGNTQNSTTSHLKALLSQVESHSVNSHKVPLRQDIPRLHLFWSEVVQFKDTVLSSMKVQSLLDALLIGHQDSVLRERVFQASLAGFYQRCEVVYPEFLDITIIFKLAILSLRLGVRTLLESTSSMVDGDVNTNHDSFVLFPTLCSSSQITRTFDTIQPSSNAIFQRILLALAASSAELSLGAPTIEILPIVETAYEQAVGLWLIDRTKEKEWQKETHTLYRSEPALDAQNEEEDFLAIFPTFGNVFENETSATNKSYESRPASRVQAKDAALLLQIHFALTTTRGSPCPQKSFDTFRKFQIETIRDLLRNSPDSLSEAIDRFGRHLQLGLLHGNLSDFTTNTNGRTYNFYTGANYQQLRRASSIVSSLRRRLQSIANEWPDQVVLKHLVEKCDSILATHATSPLARVLAMVEQLLLQTNDWEAYANRQNSIKAECDELVVLIIDWRRSELACWQTLLEAQSAAFVEEVSDWWFHMYHALVRGALTASKENTGNDREPCQSYLDSLIPLLDDFMQGGPKGQFHARLQLLGSFDRYIGMIIPLKTVTDGKTLEAINKVVHATYSYYSLYSDSLQNHLQEQRRALEKEVEGFIKLASWKDVNVEALRQSAKKTHHQLYKIIKKLREVLRQPVRDYLQPHAAGSGEVQPLHFDLVQPDHYDSGLTYTPKPQSQGLSTIHRGAHDRLYALINDHIKPMIGSSSAEAVDEVAIEIITTSAKLAEYVVPSSLSGELREKHINSVQVRKRKAWSDLLKELKCSGLSSNIKPEILRQNASQAWLRQQPIMPTVIAISFDVDKIETYFAKLCGALPALRYSLSSHHSDLSSRELQKGVTFLECGFSMAVDLRFQ
jgi:midasin